MSAPRRRLSTGTDAAASASKRPSGSSKKRRYNDTVARCLNPFCGEVLLNKQQQYCDGNRICQLHRGLTAHCAWPGDPYKAARASERSSSSSSGKVPASASSDRAAKEKPATVPATVPTLPPPLAAPTAKASRKSTVPSSDSNRPSARATETESTEALDTGGSKRRRSTAEEETSKSGKRQRAESSNRKDTTPTVQSTSVSTSAAARQVKSSSVGVIPLGVGSRSAGGRYVQSGGSVFDSSSKAIVRPPSYGKFTAPPTSTPASAPAPVTAPTPAPARTSTPPPPSRTSTPPLPASTVFTQYAPVPNQSTFNPLRAPPPTAVRALSRANSLSALPVSSADRSRDPRLAAKRISAADYLNSRNKEATSKEGGDKPPETLLTARPPHSSDAQPAVRTGPTDPRILRRTLSDSVAAPTLRQSTRSDEVAPERSEPIRRSSDSNDRSRDREHAPRSTSESYHAEKAFAPTSSANNYHRSNSDQASATTNNERPTLARASSFSSATDASSRRASSSQNERPIVVQASSVSLAATDVSTRRVPSSQNERPMPAQASSVSPAAHAYSRRAPSSESAGAPALSRVQRLLTTLLRPKFSHSDPFLHVVLMRMASFLPNALGAIRNKTTKPRKLHFYLDYANRVSEYCGASLVKVVVENGVARVLVAGRAWLTLEGPSTMALYHQLLEKLLTQSELWRELILELQSYHKTQLRTHRSAAVPGLSFLKTWTATKRRELPRLSDLDMQSNYTAGTNRHHWTFVMDNVEVGSGSDAEKVMAFRKATSSAFDFLHSITILEDKEKFRVAEIDREQPVRRRESSSNSSNSRSDTTSRDRRENPLVPPTVPPSAPTTTAQAIANEPAASNEDKRARGNSWTDTGELDAAFSPTVHSEPEQDEDDGSVSMSISDDDRPEPERKQQQPPAPTLSAPVPPVQVPVDPPTCRFCDEMQTVKAGRKCIKHEQEARSARSSDTIGNSVESLHAILRQPTANVVSPSDSTTSSIQP